MTQHEIYTKAADLIRDEAKFTQGQYARTATGGPTDPRSEDAVCFCTFGAISHVSGINFRRDTGSDVAVALSISNELEDVVREFIAPFNKESFHYTAVDINDGQFSVPDLTPREAAIRVLELAAARHQPTKS